MPSSGRTPVGGSLVGWPGLGSADGLWPDDAEAM